MTDPRAPGAAEIARGVRDRGAFRVAMVLADQAIALLELTSPRSGARAGLIAKMRTLHHALTAQQDPRP